MALPKKNTFDPFASKQGVHRQDELVSFVTDKSVYLPKTIKLMDLDEAVINYVKTELEIIIEGKTAPVFFMTKERWADFSLTWNFSDDNGNVVMPYVVLRRSAPPKPGSNEAIKYRIAQNKKFIYTEVPVYENGVLYVDVYKTPQPIPIDLEFEVIFFSHMMMDMNDFNEKIQFKFASGEDYVMVKGYYMPIMSKGVDDESTMDEFEGQRFYSNKVTLNLVGFLQDGDNFEITNRLRNVKFSIK